MQQDAVATPAAWLRSRSLQALTMLVEILEDEPERLLLAHAGCTLHQAGLEPSLGRALAALQDTRLLDLQACHGHTRATGTQTRVQ